MKCESVYRDTSLESLLQRLQQLCGLHICVWAADHRFLSKFIRGLSPQLQRHLSPFCRTVRTALGGGCGGHDQKDMVEKSAELRHPFVEVCPAGIAEAIIPLLNIKHEHIATVFVGQVRLTNREECTRAGKLSACEPVRRQHAKLPEMTEEDLLQLGMVVDLALKGLVHTVGLRNFEIEVLLENHPAIRYATERISEERQLNITEAQIAAELSLDPSYFSRLFKQVTGRTFSTFLIERRITVASGMLLTTDFSASQIAAHCGYSSQSYFTRLFQKAMGLSPIAYRKAFRKV